MTTGAAIERSPPRFFVRGDGRDGKRYSDELVAIAKHFRNVYVHLCWAWSIDPFSSGEFVRGLLHAVPANKLFAFGGDTYWPQFAVAYALQARNGLTKALQAEIDDGFLSERQAIGLASLLMQKNQAAGFDLAGTRAAIRDAAGRGCSLARS